MSQFELLKKVVLFFNETSTAYMLTGSIVSSFQGEPRSTHDIDMIIQISIENADRLIQHFPAPDYYIDKETTIKNIEANQLFKLLNTTSGDKIDFYPLPNNEYEIIRFNRKIQEEFNELKVWITTPEDTILSKLRWSKLSNGSQKQFKDALHVYELQKDILDNSYITYWINTLGLVDLFEKVKRDAEI